jgi:diacylglycerol kinase (ATP)
MRIETESEVLEREAVTVLLANCGEILPTGIAFSKDIRPDDGYMDVIVMDAATFAGAARVAWRLAFGGSTPDESLQILRAKTVKITTEPPLAAQADGDPCGRTPLTADVLEGGLTVLAPPPR